MSSALAGCDMHSSFNSLPMLQSAAYQEMSLLSEARARLVEMSALDYRTTSTALDYRATALDYCGTASNYRVNAYSDLFYCNLIM